MAQTFNNGQQLSEVRGILNGNAVDVNALQSQNAKSASDVTSLLADTSLTYTAGSNNTVVAGDVIQTRAENFSYRVAESSVTDQSVTTAGGVKLYVLTPVALAFGAKGDGITDDTGAFTACDVTFLGDIVDLYGLTYLVTAIPTAATYVGGSFLKDGFTYNMPSTLSLITATSDTGGTDPVYSGGVLNLAPFSGRTTKDLFSLFNSQNSRSRGPARAVNVGSIYSDASGNVSGNYTSRQCLAWVPQSVNIGSEECWVWGGFRGGNYSSQYSGCENESNANVSARYSVATGRNSVNIASVSAYAGRGGGARFTVTVTSGSVTGVAVNRAGAKYQVGDALKFFDRTGSGSSAAAQVATIDGSGGILTVTISAGGSGYSSNVDATVDNGTGDFSANIATTTNCVTSGEASANIASNNQITSGLRAASMASQDGTTSGQNAAQIASNAGTASGSQSCVIASNGSTASGIGSSVISGNNSTSDLDGAVVIGRRVKPGSIRALSYGDSSSGAASTANRKFEVLTNGNVTAAGTFTGNTVYTDYAEYFENASVGTVPLGVIVTLDGRKVRAAKSGDDILGVVSATALIVAGDSPFTWSRRFLTGEFGEMLYESYWDEDDQAIRQRPMENPEYDPDLQNVPRSKRPDEWTCVGLLGQVHVRVGADVAVGNWVSANGNTSKSQTNLRCMEIRIPYNASKGYAVAFCLLK